MSELKMFMSHLLAMALGGGLTWAYIRFSKPKAPPGGSAV